MSAPRAWARAALTAAGVVAIDQLTKALARGSVARGDEDPVFPALKLVNVRNDGVAFGIDAGGSAVLFVVVAVALLAVVLYFARHAAKPLAWLPTGLLVGGAVGNILDRIRDGAVTDFLKIPLWPAFNLADVAIVAGVIALVIVLESDGRAAERHA